MKVDDVTGKISCTYPWKPCVTRMCDNKRQAQKVQEKMERHMVRTGTHQEFVEEVGKSIEDGRVRLIEPDEIASWHGPVHYVTVFWVFKAGSVSTKTRVVSNSALQNPHSRLSLNQCMWPGPNALVDLLDCLLFWRSVEVALMLDLRKAYQAIFTSAMDLHLRGLQCLRQVPDVLGVSPATSQNDVKLGGLGLYAVPGSPVWTATDPPSPPLLHEVKLPGLVAGGRSHALQHEVKLFALNRGPLKFGAGGRIHALQHEVKLLGHCTCSCDDHPAAPKTSSMFSLQPGSSATYRMPQVIPSAICTASQVFGGQLPTYPKIFNWRETKSRPVKSIYMFGLSQCIQCIQCIGPGKGSFRVKICPQMMICSTWTAGHRVKICPQVDHSARPTPLDIQPPPPHSGPK